VTDPTRRVSRVPRKRRIGAVALWAFLVLSAVFALALLAEALIAMGQGR
jgi:hypothetical protein